MIEEKQQPTDTVVKRDLAGALPVYYWQQKDVLHTSTDLLATELKEKQADPKGIFEYLIFGHGMEGRTPLHEVTLLKPGYDLKTDGKTHLSKKNPYLNHDKDNQFEGFESETIDSAFDSASKQIGTKKAGVFLSGGIDSALIAAELRRRNITMEAFTIDIPDDPNSEANKAETVANILDIPLHRVNLSVNDIKEILPGLVKMTGPFMLPSPLLRARLAQAAQNAECEHVVTGDGPDELYAGYTSMLPGVRKGEIPGLDGFLERLGINLFTDWAFKPPHAEEWVAAWMAISPLFSKKFKEGIDLETLTAAHKRLATYIYELGLSKLDRMIAYELETRMRWSVDSVSSAPVRFIYGAPPVTPLFSPSVIFNSSITPEQLKVNIRGGTWYGKYLLRQMLATNLKYFRASDSDVEEIAWGPKRGMFTPISHLIQDAFPEVKNVDEFNPEAVSSTLQSQQSDLGHQVAMTSVITTDVFLTEVKKQ